MARIFITGSSDGIGLLTARSLVQKGHSVTLHARNVTRGKEAMSACPGASDVLIGDLSSIASTKALADSANKTGAFDTVIHNAGVGYAEAKRITDDGIPHLFAINALAPYILTAMMTRPKKLIYVSSGLHSGGDAEFGDKKHVTWQDRRWNGLQAYSDSKLFNVILAFATARLWPEVSSNAISPGWVKTKMGGSSAPGSAEKGAEIPIRLASSKDDVGTGQYLASSSDGRSSVHPAAKDEVKQDEFLKLCEKISGVPFPGA